MSAGPDPQIDSQVIEQERRRLSRRLDEVARLCEANVPPSTFYGEMLKRLLESLAAPAGAVWGRTAQGNLQLQFQINAREVGLDKSEEGRKSHEELLRLAVTQPRPIHLLPHSGTGPAEEGKTPAGNPTDYILLLVPIMLNEQVAGLIEVWQSPNRPLNAIPGFLQFMALMAELGTRYLRNQMLGQMTGQQQLWTQLEGFARQVHASLHPTEVSYLVANEGRRLIECDRVSVAVRRGRRTVIEAVSGADVVERRSSLIQTMRKLADEVINWGEKLSFTGTKDDSLPPKVLEALDAYLGESASKLLVVQPLHDERQGEKKDKNRKPARSALVMECFEPPAEPQQITSRLEVVARHATPALYNAVEHRRIPMRFIWMPLAKVQEGLGGKARAIWTAIIVGVSFLASAMYLVPYPLKMDATGQLLPQVRRQVCPPVPGQVVDFHVLPTEEVGQGRNLATLYDVTLDTKLRQLRQEMLSAGAQADEADNAAHRPGVEFAQQQKYLTDAQIKRITQVSKREELDGWIKRTNANSRPDMYGFFALKAPLFTPEEAALLTKQQWTVLSGNFREEWKGKEAKPSEPLLRLGAKDGPWEIEMKIPQKHLGQILYALEQKRLRGQPEVLDVDFLLQSDTTRTFKGKLAHEKIAGEANPMRDDNNEQEPVVIAYVRITGDDIEPGYRLPPHLLLSGTEVHAKVRCGNHRMGYSLFYGLWEFFYEKVVFWF